MTGETKRCETCGGVMTRPRWKNGKLDSTWKNRRYCSSQCYGKANEKANPSLPTLRKRDQRRLPTTECQHCGQTTRLQRHHGNKQVVVLCQKCHTAEHMKDGTWGRSQESAQAS